MGQILHRGADSIDHEILRPATGSATAALAAVDAGKPVRHQVEIVDTPGLMAEALATHAKPPGHPAVVLVVVVLAPV